MKASEFQIQPFDVLKHRRETFQCESEALTTYLRERARREMDSKAAACFVMTLRTEPDRIVGYYTLSSASILPAQLPVNLSKRLPKYPQLPATLLGRLARHIQFKGKGLGELLLLSAFKRAWEHSHEIASLALLTDPKDDAARAFYERFGFQSVDERRLYLPMSEVGRWLKD